MLTQFRVSGGGDPCRPAGMHIFLSYTNVDGREQSVSTDAGGTASMQMYSATDVASDVSVVLTATYACTDSPLFRCPTARTVVPK